MHPQQTVSIGANRETEFLSFWEGEKKALGKQRYLCWYGMMFLNYDELQQAWNKSWLFSKLFRSSLKNLDTFIPLPWQRMRLRKLDDSRRDLCTGRQRHPGGSAPSAAWEPLPDFPVGRLSFPISLHKQKTDRSFPDRHYHFSFPEWKTLLYSNSVTNSLNIKSLFVVFLQGIQ